MTIEALENLVKIHKLKKEPPDQVEFDGMLAAAEIKLQDAKLQGLSQDSQFLLAYSASHTLALAALRWHGYRADSRYIVFQCLQHTLNLSATEWRIFDQCHNRRNVAEYEGHLEIDEALLKELIRLTHQLLGKVKALEPIG